MLVCKYDGSEKHFDPALHNQNLPVSLQGPFHPHSHLHISISIHHSVMLLANNGSEETIPHLLPRRGLFHDRGGGTVCGREHGCVRTSHEYIPERGRMHDDLQRRVCVRCDPEQPVLVFELHASCVDAAPWL